MTKHNKIPNGWHETEFFNIAEVSKEKYNPKKELINYKCLELEHLSQETSKILGYIDVNKTNSIKNKFYKGDILFGKLRPYLKKHVIPNFDGVCSSEIWVLKPKNNINNKYLFNLITTFKFIQVANASAGSKMPRSDWTYMREYVFKIPRKIEEQEKIAGALEVWDEAMSNIQKQITNAQQTKKALMQHVFKNDSNIKKVKLGSVANMKSGGTPKSTNDEYYLNGNIPWVSISDMTKSGKFINNTEKSITNLGLQNSSAVIYPTNTILYAMYASIGESCITEKEVSSSQAILGIEVKEGLNYIYLYYYLNFIKENMIKSGQQGTQSNLNKGIVESIKIPLPNNNRQQHIAQILTNADEVISNLESQLANVHSQKKALMQKLLTGDVRFKEFVS